MKICGKYQKSKVREVTYKRKENIKHNALEKNNTKGYKIKA